MFLRQVCWIAVVVLFVSPKVRSEPIPWKISEEGNGHWYQIVSGNWHASEETSQLLGTCGGHLVAINDSNEWAWVATTFGPFSETEWNCNPPPSRFWIGLNDEVEEGSWTWSTEEPVTFTNWYPGEPNGITVSNWAYVGRYDTGGWNDGPPCDAAYGIAEFEIKGDFNQDGEIDELDVPFFISVLLGESQSFAYQDLADMNCDGLENGHDIQGFVDTLL